jgi:hypothetical protein
LLAEREPLHAPASERHPNEPDESTVDDELDAELDDAE